MRKDIILGSRRFSIYWWASIILLGGVGFLLVGISSYLHHNLLFFLDSSELVFIPQGVIMVFYGTAAICLGLYLWLTILWDIGGGYNEFNKKEKIVKIYRKGFPGKNREIFLSYPIADIKSIKVFIKEGLNPKREIYLDIKNKGFLPLTKVGQPISLLDLENQAVLIAKFLGIKLESLEVR
uniref:photosystem I assembly protein Ycf4 n=1 Tax=Glaucosphaera vacuolata TaxID=38265 RepID=UPI001FCDEE2E|nr:photosystem I assembly protein Ycf4 [Glaucosphaera vacuolata]UNJ18584.1 photosystem I assembly protein Ycf4 [Glaucosphaera vacuolata]